MSNAGENIIVNGGFEAGISGWSLSGASDYTGLDVEAHSGSGEFHAGSIGADSHLSQTVATSAGEDYGIDFWLKNEGGPHNDFSVQWNGQTLLALVDAPAQPYTLYHYDVTADSSSSRLTFNFRQDPSWWDLDDVNVASGGSQTPSQEEVDFASGASDAGASGSRRPAMALQSYVNNHLDEYQAAVQVLGQDSNIQQIASTISSANVAPGGFLRGAIEAGIGGAVLSEAAGIGAALGVGVLGAEVLGAALVVGGVITAYESLTGDSRPSDYIQHHLGNAIHQITTDLTAPQ